MISVLRKKRFFKELSIYDISQETGIDPSRISLLERGYKTPKNDEKEKLAKVFGCKVKELFPENSGGNRAQQ